MKCPPTPEKKITKKTSEIEEDVNKIRVRIMGLETVLTSAINLSDDCTVQNSELVVRGMVDSVRYDLSQVHDELMNIIRKLK